MRASHYLLKSFKRVLNLPILSGLDHPLQVRAAGLELSYWLEQNLPL